jgi:Mg2+-importing ATPase
MLPVQILLNNLLYDFSQTAIPFDRVDADYLGVPRKWRINDIRSFMVYLGPVSSLFDYATFALMCFVFSANTVENQALFQTGWFVESLMTQTLVVYIIRTSHVPFLQSNPAPVMAMVTMVVMAAAMAIPYTPIASALGFTSLPLVYFAWLAAILLGYCLLAQLVKTWYVRRFGYS